jgi:hypothetical protein
MGVKLARTMTLRGFLSPKGSEGEAFVGLRATCRRLRWPKLAEVVGRRHTTVTSHLEPQSGDKFGYALPSGKAQATSLRDGYALPFGKAQATSPRDPHSKVLRTEQNQFACCLT